MLFNWDTTGLCIITSSWHVRGTVSLIASLLGVILLTAGYEAIRELSRQYESRSAVVKDFDAGRTSPSPSNYPAFAANARLYRPAKLGEHLRDELQDIVRNTSRKSSEGKEREREMAHNPVPAEIL